MDDDDQHQHHLSIEIQQMWNMKCFVIPIIIGAMGIVNKSLKIPGNNTKTTFNTFSTKKKKKKKKKYIYIYLPY
jgi:hypothetical protein